MAGTYLLYLLILGLFVVLYVGRANVKKSSSRASESVIEPQSREPRYILEFMANEYRNSVEELFGPKDKAPMQGDLKSSPENNKELVDKLFSEYTEAIKTDPQDHVAHNNLGNIYLYKGMPAEATKEYLEAIRLSPGSYEALSNLGAACFLTKKYNDAVVVLGESLKLKPDFAPAHNNLGIVHLRKQSYDLAMEEFVSALKTSPENEAVRYNVDLCSTMKKTGMYENIAGSFP